MFSPWSRPAQNIPELDSMQQFEQLAAQECFIVFKHSPTCPVSVYAHGEVSRFCSRRPEVPVYLVSVRRQREVSRQLAEQTGVTHESPQVLVFRHGKIISWASHDDITADSLIAMVEGKYHPSPR